MNPFASILQSWLDQQPVMVSQINKLAEDEYILACKNWAENHGRTGTPFPPPVSPFRMEVVITLEPISAVFGYTKEPVSKVKPESFLQVYGTDTNAAAPPVVGGPIPGQENRYYLHSKDPGIWYHVAADGRQFVKMPNGPMGRMWAELNSGVKKPVLSPV